MRDVIAAEKKEKRLYKRKRLKIPGKKTPGGAGTTVVSHHAVESRCRVSVVVRQSKTYRIHSGRSAFRDSFATTVKRSACVRPSSSSPLSRTLLQRPGHDVAPVQHVQCAAF